MSAHDRLELRDRPLEVVVHERVTELGGGAALPPRELEPFLDLARALGCAGAQPPLQLLPARRGDEDRDRSRHTVADGERATGLELEQRHPAVRLDAVDLRPQCPRALAPRELHVLEQLAGLEPSREFFLGEEPVVLAVDLARTALPG